ncbi:MAG: response regulator [Leptospirales bacterium]|nr:response regulator [Leptospirales bacterium]
MRNVVSRFLKSDRFDPIKAMVGGLLVTMAIFGTLGYNLWAMQKSFDKLVSVDFALRKLTDQVVYLDELLTMSARLAVATGELRWQKRWESKLEPIDNAIKEANKIDQAAFKTAGAEQTQKANDTLAALETAAMEKLNKGSKQDAYDIMFGKEYEENKRLHKGGMDLINESIEKRLVNQISEVNQKLILIGALLATSLGLMMLAWGVVIYLVKHQATQQALVLASERKAKEAQEEVVKQLQEMDKIKDAFLANTSHELRTPLNGIIGLAESMVDGAAGQVTQVQKENLDMIVSSGKRLASLVNDILDFSKLKHKDIELQLKAVDMRSISDVVLAFSKPLLAGKPIQVINAIPSHLAAVRGDENRLQQVMMNLVGNAVKFTESGRIEVTGKQNGDMIEITVSDTGIGIPQDKFERIFESFEQADGSTARQYGGTGIGLAITKKMVELHQGKIWLTSEVGKGSQFTFSIPLSTEAAAPPTSTIARVELEAEAASEEAAAAFEGNVPPDAVPQSATKDTATQDSPQKSKSKSYAPSGQPERARILIVDDEPVNLQVLSNHLSLNNYQIERASNGVEAVDRIKRGEKFDLILLDVMMPRMSGYEVAETIREKFPASELPILLLTAKNQTSDLVSGFEAGANDYLTKPVNKSELMARVKMHLLISRVNAAFGRFVPKEFLSILGHENIVEVVLGEQIMKNMTILFSDIRSFTTLSEGMTPKQNFDFINGYLGRFGPVIRKNEGFIDKYIGDAIMALFPSRPDDAVQTAVDMLSELKLYNEHRESSGYPPVNIGVGIHTGNLMLGTVGEAQRMEGTVISDAVNLASRLESLTKKFGIQAIISEDTLDGLSPQSKFDSRFLGKVKVKGKTKMVTVYELLSGQDPEILDKRMGTKPQFEKAVNLFFSKSYGEANVLFQQIVAADPGDKPARIYMDRCAELLVSDLVA